LSKNPTSPRLRGAWLQDYLDQPSLMLTQIGKMIYSELWQIKPEERKSEPIEIELTIWFWRSPREEEGLRNWQYNSRAVNVKFVVTVSIRGHWIYITLMGKNPLELAIKAIQGPGQK